ncbi:MAG TPA: Do family serine endopeptidase [Candidatus Limnocylindria bacterium]|nr:Do family serine endopeptidase [Candidatus Limnocylindria bacterium]
MKQDSVRGIRPRSYYIGAAALVLVGLMIGLGLSTSLDLQRVSTAGKSGLAAITSSTPLPESPFVGVVEKALPAVVFIDVRKKLVARSGDDPQDDLFRRFFGDQMRREQRVPSSGSGFIVDKQGHVLTNNHVVRDADDITVTLNDRRSFKAKVVGSDPETDVAVIKIDARELPTLPLGDSDHLRVGDWAIAIGNPLGELRGSVTVGVISAQGRSNLNIFGGTPGFQDFIQTDASINFGNSGGPLCNIRGEAIGINTAINPSGQGIGFAIPINLAKHVADQLVAHGTVKRAMMGVMLAELTPEIADGFGLETRNGVLISNVIKDSPAEQAGLRRNDVIVEFDGKPVADMQKFRIRVADTEVGRKVPMVVLRDGKRVSVAITLGERDTQLLAQGERPGNPATAEPTAGLTVREPTADELANSGAKGGVVVTEVENGSAAADAGIQSGDVIEEIGGKPVTSPAVLARQLKDAKGRGARHGVLLVTRNRTSQFVALDLEE